MGDTGFSPGHVRGEWCGPGGRHLLTVTYSWRLVARWPFVARTHQVRCFECDVVVKDPC